MASAGRIGIHWKLRIVWRATQSSSMARGHWKADLMNPLRRKTSAALWGANPWCSCTATAATRNMAVPAPAFSESHRTVLLDLVGFGASDLKAYDRPKYSSLEGHARNLWRSSRRWTSGT